jgi:hypothetical protein
MNRILFLLFAGFLLCAIETYAQIGGATSAYTKIGSNPRTIGIGNAYVAGGAEGIYTIYNPAMAPLISSKQIDLTGAAMSFDRRFAGLTAALPLPPNAGLSLNLLYAGVYNFDGRTQSGYHTNSFNTHDLQMTASFGILVSEKTSVGTSLKFQTARYNENVNAPIGFGIDLGIIYRYSENLRFGAAVQDLLTNYVWDTQEVYGTIGSNQRTEKMPIRLKTGATYTMLEGNLNLYTEFEHRITSAEQLNRIAQTNDGRIFVRKTTENTRSTAQFLRLGTSYEIHERAVVRAGWQSGDLDYIDIGQQFSTGFTIRLPFDLYQPEIDYAVLREPNGVSWMHMFSIRLNITE